jgi:trehalose/maltose transport system permease protein
LAAIIYFLSSVNADNGIREAVNWTSDEAEGPRPSLILAFLDSFGIVMPVLIIVLGTFFIGLGLRLRTLNINAAQWTGTTLTWLAIGLGTAAFLNLLINGMKLSTLQTALPLGLVAVVSAASLMWMNRSFDVLFVGQETYRARETRTAWNLLIPTLAVLILVAARPLEQSFITSLTDKVFASDQVPRFVGLDNYEELLSLRVDEVECRRDEDTGACRRGPDGSIRWATIDRGQLENGYRTAWNIQLPLIQPNDQSIAISGQDRDWLRSMWTTLQFTVASVALELVIGLFIAMVVNSNFRGRGMMRAVMLVPWAIPTVISARLWELILKDSTAGIVNRVLMDLGLLDRPEAWLVQTHLQVPSAVMVDVWKTSPFMALLLLAGLQTIPADLYEAAAVDGANRFRQFLNITLPMLRPTIAVALVFRTLDALRVFDLFNVLYGRQQLTMATYNYETLVNNQADGYASAVGVLIFLFIFAFAVMYVRLLGVETE